MTEELVEWDPPSEIDSLSHTAKPWSGEDLPLIDRHSEMIRKRLRNLTSSPALAELLTSFQNETGLSLAHEGPIVADRPSGLKRVGITIQWFCPTLGTRVGLGIETPLAHRVIDRSLGHQRSDAQNHLPTTPVEWGFWTVLAAKLTDLLNQSNTLPRLVLDRVGPDSFDTTGLGPCSTIAWELNHLDQPVGVIRAWVPATLTQDLETGSAQSNKLSDQNRSRFLSESENLVVLGRVQAGMIHLAGGVQRLRPKLVLPWTDSPLTGSLSNPSGPVVCRMGSGPSRWSFSASLVSEPQGQQFEVLQKPKYAPTPLTKGFPIMSADGNPASSDLPITLTVELGRLSLTLSKLSELKPGDILGLMRNASEPVDLTSGDRLVARGELVQIDQELGIRILQVLI